MKTTKNDREIRNRRLFKFENQSNRGLSTTDPTSITINTNTGTTATIITHLSGTERLRSRR